MARRTLRKMTWGWVEGFLNVSKAFRRLDAAEGTYLKEIQVTVWSDIHVRSGLNPIGGKTSLQAEQHPARHFRESHESSHPLRTALRERVVLLHTPKIIHVALCLAPFVLLAFVTKPCFAASILSYHPRRETRPQEIRAACIPGNKERVGYCEVPRAASCVGLIPVAGAVDPPPILLYRWGWRRLSTTL